MSNNQNNPQKWVQYDSEECPKCKTRTANVLTRSTEDNLIYDGEEARCFTCQHTGVVSVEDSECADVVWDDYNPQEVPQVKSVEEILLDELSDHHVKYLESLPFFKDWVLQAMEIYAQSRIAELEAENAKLSAHNCDNPYGDEIIVLEKQNAVYREALEKIANIKDVHNNGNTETGYMVIALFMRNQAEQALNHKDK